MAKITQTMAKRLENWQIGKLQPYENNARTHSQEQVQQIAASITEFGFNNPILIDKEAGIVAGHGRYEAAKLLNLKEVPVIVLDHLTEAQKKAYIIADNKIALNAGWDEAILKKELESLMDTEFDLEALGFSSEELEKMLSEPVEIPEDSETGNAQAKPEPSMDGSVRKVSLFYKNEKYEPLMAMATRIVVERGLSDMSELFEFLVAKEHDIL